MLNQKNGGFNGRCSGSLEGFLRCCDQWFPIMAHWGIYNQRHDVPADKAGTVAPRLLSEILVFSYASPPDHLILATSQSLSVDPARLGSGLADQYCPFKPFQQMTCIESAG